MKAEMRSLVVCALLLLAAVVVVVSGAFDDTDFDEFMRDENGQVLSRVRRTPGDTKDTQSDADKKKKKQRKSCCGENDDSKLLWSEGVKDIKKECFEQARKAMEVPSKARMMEGFEGFMRGNRTKDEYICAVQCIGQKKEVLDHMGNIMKDKMEAYIANVFANDPWKLEVTEKVKDKCFTESQKPSEGQVSTDTGDVTNARSIEAKCNPNGIAFIHCLWREMQLNCPDGQLRENRKCNRLRDRLRGPQTEGSNGTTRSIFRTER